MINPRHDRIGAIVDAVLAASRIAAAQINARHISDVLDDAEYDALDALSLLMGEPKIARIRHNRELREEIRAMQADAREAIREARAEERNERGW